MKNHRNYVFIYLFIFIFSSIFYIDLVFAEESPVNVSNTLGASIRHQILVEQNIQFFVWEDHSNEKAEILFTKSIDEGKNFAPAINLSNNNGSSLWPRLAMSENDIYVTWYDYTPHISDVFFSHSSDRGLTFETINLSKDIGVSFNPWIAASGDSVYVVWMDDTPNYIELNVEKPSEEIDVYFGNTDILLAISHDRGGTFEIFNLSNNPIESSAPRLIVSENNVHVAWIQQTQNGNQVYYTRSNDSGFSFSPPKSVSTTVKTSVNAGILVQDDIVFVSWMGENDNKSDIFIAKSDDGGNSFDVPVNLSNSEFYSSKTRDTHMSFSNNSIYLVWTEGTLENADVFFVKSNDNGQTFSQPANLSNSAKGARYPQVVTYDQNVYVMWSDRLEGNPDVFLRSSSDGGETFGSIENLSSDDANSVLSILGPHLATTTRGVYAGWSSIDVENEDVFLKFNYHNPDSIGALFLETENNSVIIELEIIQEKIEIDTETSFAIKFFNPDTNELLENVNYSFYLQDSKGNSIITNNDQIAKNGSDIQTIIFSQTGSVNLIIEVHGLGMNLPYDPQHSGSTSAVITVVPEFPIGILGIMAFALGASILFRKLSLVNSK